MTPQVDPIAEFLARQSRVAAVEHEQGTAATLATVGTDGMPSARVVLVKRVDERGFAFFTNYSSRKARELDGARKAALCFFWPSVYQQVRVEGDIERLDEAASDAYFASRPRGSQIGAWASRQSTPLATRAELEARVARYETEFVGRDVPRPPFWGGFLLRPSCIELWQGQESRLHDREIFHRTAQGWTRERLYP